MTLTARILKELEKGPGTHHEIAAALKSQKPKSVSAVLGRLVYEKRVTIIGRMEHRANVLGGRKETIYALPGTPMLKTEDEARKRRTSDSDAIAGGAYRIAGRITVKQIKFPAKANRGFAQ